MSDKNQRGKKSKIAAEYADRYTEIIRVSLKRSQRMYRLLVENTEKRPISFPGYLRDIISHTVAVLLALFSLGRKTIKKAPGYPVLAAAEFLCSPKTIDQVFEPLVSDWQEEYFAALNQSRWFKARWISLRYLWKAVLAFGLSKLLAAVRAFSTKR